jgi:hypothetical protein
MSRENRSCLSASFFGFLVFLLQSRSCRSCYGQLEANLAKPKEVFVQHMPIYNNLLHFFPGVSIEEKKMSVRTPFLQKLGPSFMADSSRFWGIRGYFWPRRLNITDKLVGDISPIYSEDFNVKRFDL